MNVTRLSIHHIDLPVADGSYKMTSDSPHTAFDTTIVRLETDADVTGYGETSTLGSTYLPAYGAGVRTGIEELHPVIIGSDPTQPAVLSYRMDGALEGHPYVKSAVDMACWDILGKHSGTPVCELLGGRFGNSVPLYRAISQDTPAAMADSVAHFRQEGYEKFQLKVGDDPIVDAARIRACCAEVDESYLLDADANTGYTQHEAVRLVNELEDTDYYLEQPCPTYNECLAVRQQTTQPLILDEILDSAQPIVRGYADGAMDAVNLKISKVGGITRARALRDLCAELGLAMILEDTWGGDIATTAIAHLAQSTPPDYRLAATDFNSYNDLSTATGGATGQDGQMTAPTDPGLGVEPRTALLEDPVVVYE